MNPWRSSINEFVREFQRFTSPEPNDAVDFGKVVVSIAAQAPDDAIITTDAGNMSTWVHRHWVMTPKNTLLGAIAGAMGFGVPTAVAAAIVDSTRMAITFVGDGGILMTGQELATADPVWRQRTQGRNFRQRNLDGTIRTHQEDTIRTGFRAPIWSIRISPLGEIDSGVHRHHHPR